MSKLKIIVPFLMILTVVAACAPSGPAPTPTATPQTFGATTAPVTATVPAQSDGGPAATPIGPYGPTGFPADVNPLTGLPVAGAEMLNRRPLLIKISNESDQVRPQSGWGFADHVWEYQMEGFAQTRFTAVYYGQTAQQVGSVRSARLIDVDHLVDMYGGIFVYSGASSNFDHEPPGPPRVAELIRQKPWFNRAVSEQLGAQFGPPLTVRIPDVPRPGVASWHTLFAVPDEIWKWAEQNDLKQKPNLEGLAFDLNPPAGGTVTTQAVIDYPGIGPKRAWQWDAARNLWLSSTDDKPDYDFLVPDQQLGFENVIFLYVPHYQADFLEQEGELGELFSVGLLLTGEGDAVIMRNGQRYTAKWYRVGTEGMLQFKDASGATIPLRPGRTYFNTADTIYFAPAITFTPQ
jgi:hypothetical protein